MNKTIYLVEDDQELAELMRDYLIRFNFNVRLFHEGQCAIHNILAHQPDLVILDIMLPDINGIEICRKIRGEYAGIILIHSALEEDSDQMIGLEAGADDYIVKHIQPRLLLSKIHALLRHTERSKIPQETPNQIQNTPLDDSQTYGPLSISLQRRHVELHQQAIDLTPTEFELLRVLLHSAGQVVTRTDLIQQLRGFDYDGLDRSIDRRVSRLRKKLCLNNGEEIIKTIRGIGYQLCIAVKQETYSQC